MRGVAMTGPILMTWTLAAGMLAAPPPPILPPAPPPLPFDIGGGDLERESYQFAEVIGDLSERIAAEYPRPVKPETLLLAALTKVYAAGGLDLPDHFRDRVLAAGSPGGRRQVAQQARLALGNVEAVEGMLATVVAVDGFAEVTDPYCELMAVQGSVKASSGADFGRGFELAGAEGPRWLAFTVDQANASSARRVPGAGMVPCPVAFPWQVTRVIPGSPAAAAGLRPGDVITQMDDVTVSARTSRILIARLLNLRPVTFVVQRPKVARPVTIKIDSDEDYTPESIFGVCRLRDDSWDYWLDRDAKIGYIRVGAVETGADEVFRAAVAGLIKDDARGLILDLRWCPGGYVTPTTRIAGLLLPEGKPITAITNRHPERQSQSDFAAEAIAGREAFVKLPLIVLIGPETVGGGEMIAAALKDNERGRFVGQRTFGKANVMTPIATRINGLMYKISTGYSLRPTGENRHRFVDSQPGDPWGVRPDPGLVVPQTPDLTAELGRAAALQAIRPAGDRTALRFDDPLADPQKMIALRWLKEQARRSEDGDEKTTPQEE